MTVTIPYVRGNSETITGILQPNSIVCYTQTNDHFTTTAYKLMSKDKDSPEGRLGGEQKTKC